MRYAYLMFLTVLVAAVVALGPGSGTPNMARASDHGTTITIPGDDYSPPVLVINVGETVTWVNKDSDPHVTTSVPGAPESFTVVTGAGKTGRFTFTKAGVYQYYCSTHAAYNAKLGRVVANKDSDAFPIAMEGIIVVKGPGLTGGPEGSLAFAGGNIAPDFTVIMAGGKVTWTNKGAKDRMLQIPGAGVQKFALPAGKSQTVRFAKPGVYLFYDSNAATLDPKLGLAKAKPGTSAFPVSMQGYVIVL
jgi:plastocyanin